MGSVRFGARAGLWLILAIGYGLMLWLNLPGHLSLDSVLALHEGRTGVRESWAPALFAWTVGSTDRLVSGTSLYLVLSGFLLFGVWGAMAMLRPRTSWWASPVAAAAILIPNVLIYQGIVWKDVLFANVAVAGFVSLALASKVRRRSRSWALFGVAAVIFAAAGLLRQNGLVLMVPALAAVAWNARAQGWRGAAGLAAGWGVSVAVLTLALSIVAQPQGVGLPDIGGSKGVRLVQHYDLAASVARDPGRSLPHIAAVDPAAANYILAHAGKQYSPQRIDSMGEDPQLIRALWRLPDEVVRTEWFDLITRRPATYLSVRFDAFRWVFATPVIDRCLPVWVGVDGPPEALAELGMTQRRSLSDTRLYNYATWFMDTPVMSHLAYAGLALAVAGLLLVRREPADMAMLALLVGAILFTASFFIISLACDYRYLYFLDLAAITGAVYLALDPRLKPNA